MRQNPKNQPQQQEVFSVLKLIHDNPTAEISKLINFINENPDLKKAFAEIIFDNIDTNNPSEEQQKVLNKIKSLSSTDKNINLKIDLNPVIKEINQAIHNYDNKEALLADDIIRLPNRIPELINFIEANPKLKQSFVDIVFGNWDIDEPNKTTIEEQQIFVKINELYLNPTKLKRLIDNYPTTIPKYEEYKKAMVELTSLPQITNYAQKLDKELELKQKLLETKEKVNNFLPKDGKRSYSDSIGSQEQKKKEILTTNKIKRSLSLPPL